MSNEPNDHAARIGVEPAGEGILRVILAGDWRLTAALPDVEPVSRQLREAADLRGLKLDAANLTGWDTGLLTTVLALRQAALERQLEVDDAGLPDGARRLLKLAAAGGPVEVEKPQRDRPGIVAATGQTVVNAVDGAREGLQFLGELILSFGRLFRGKARFERADLFVFLSQAGIEALPIVSLISFLVGLIFAFVGVMQLEQFGAGIYVADLVAVAMVREMSAIMTGIIMAGRTGAAYAAQIGTMKVTEEIDALRTLGLDVMDYLVLPRTLALVLMLPLLTLYASLMGILGGMVASLAMLDVSLVQYIEQTKGSLELDSLFGGLFKALVYGIVVALAGCRQGLACGATAMDVGKATTSAVVIGILLIVITASILTVIYTTIGI